MPPTPTTPIPTIRTRRQDEFKSPSEYKRQCRKTVQIGETIFRCELNHKDDLTTHREAGIMKRKGARDVRYEITWTEMEENLTIRYAPQQQQHNKPADLTTRRSGGEE